MTDAFLLIALPYLAMFTCVVGCFYRWKMSRYTYSSLSSQFLENKQLLWGSAPFHIGIIGVLLGHIVALCFPDVWISLMSRTGVLIAVEILGLALTVLCIAGLGVLIFRRLTSARVQAVTTTMDLVVVSLLMAQVLLGLLVALQYRWGSAWASGTISPYLWSLVTLRPDMSYVAGFPILIKLHMSLAWVLILLLPFSRLVHVLAVPFEYLFRAPQLVIWNTRRRQKHAVAAAIQAESRREFLKGAAGVAIAGVLVSLGASGKLINFFRGPRPDKNADAEILTKKLRRLNQTAEERSLELERMQNEFIQIAKFSELSAKKGKYFTDYAMNPGLAFLGDNGLPLLISAKCTHLGCTVGSEVDSQDRILCPCHVSYFNIKTGIPNAAAPTKVPLPHLGWALMDGAGTILARGNPGGQVEEIPPPEALADSIVYITKPHGESAS